MKRRLIVKISLFFCAYLAPLTSSGVFFCPKSHCFPLDFKAACDYVCKAAGRHGAVREFIEWLMEKNESCGTG